MPPDNSIEFIYHKLRSQFGFETDELKVLYPTEDKLREFFATTMAESRKALPEDTSKWAEDDFKLPPDAEVVVRQINASDSDFKQKVEAIKHSALAQKTGLKKSDVDSALAALKEPAAKPKKKIAKAKKKKKAS